MLKKRRLVISLVLIAGILTAAQDNIVIRETRPLAKLVAQHFWDRYGFLITYEEGPYDGGNELFTDVYPTGRPSHYPAWKPVNFHVPKIAEPADGVKGASPELASATVASVAESAVAEYNASGSPGRFRVIQDGDYAHIVPEVIARDGVSEQFQPILDTKVSFGDTQPRPCFKVVNDLFSQIERMRGVSIATSFPANFLLRHECKLDGSNVTARDAVRQLLLQLEATSADSSGWSKHWFSWTMMHDADSGKYFMNIYPVKPNVPAPWKKVGAAAPAPQVRTEKK